MVLQQASILSSCFATRYAVKVTRKRYGYEKQEGDVRVEEGRVGREGFGNKTRTILSTH